MAKPNLFTITNNVHFDYYDHINSFKIQKSN